MTKYSKKLAKGTFTIFVFTILSGVVGYLIKIILARSTSPTEVGLFFSVLSFISFFIFLRDFGLSDSLIFFIPKFKSKKKYQYIKSSIIFTSIVQFGISLLFLLIIFVISDWLAIQYFGDIRSAKLLKILALFFGISGFNEVLYRIFHGFQKFILNQLIEFSFSFFVLLSFFIISFFGIDVIKLGLSYVSSALITLVIFFFVFYFTVYKIFFTSSIKFYSSQIKEMIKYAFPMMLSSIGNQMFGQQSILFLTFFVGLKTVGFYVIALSIAKVTVYFSKSLIHVFSPMITEMWVEKKNKLLNSYINELLISSLVVTLPILLGIFVYSEEIMLILFGQEYIVASKILIILALYFIIFNTSSLLRRILLCTEHPKEANKIIYVILVTNLILNFVLIPLFGLNGAAWSDLLSALVGISYAIIKINKLKLVKFKYWSIAKIIFLNFLCLLIIFSLKKYIKTDIYFELIVIVLILVPTYLFLLLKFKLISLKRIKKLVL